MSFEALLQTRWGRSAKAFGFRLAHRLARARLRFERELAGLRPGTRRPRIVATACWTFPIYSQTFVYREVAELARAGFDVRFLYSGQGPRTELGRDLQSLWRLRRRVFLDETIGASDLEHYRRRVPERVEAMLAALSDASGLSRDVLATHLHVRHAFAFARMVEAWGADYLHSYFFYERTLFAFVAASLLDLPRGVSCYADHLLHDYELKMVPLHLRSSTIVVATSRRIRDELVALQPGCDPRVIVKPNAIAAATWQTGTPGAPRNGPWVMLVVSRIDPKKGLEYLMDALQQLTSEGLDVTLRIAGEPDEHAPASVSYWHDLQARIRAGGLASRVALLGRLTADQVRRELEGAHVFVAPFVELATGDKDGIPTALLEAMAAGRAIVATDAGSISEVVEDGVEALVVPQRDAHALAAAVGRLIGDPVLRTTLGQNAARRVRAQFDVHACEGTLHERIRACLGEGRPMAHAHESAP